MDLDALGGDDEAGIRSALEEVATGVDRDPLGVLERIMIEIRPALDAVKAEAARVRLARDKADRDLAAAVDAMGEISTLDRLATEALEQCRAKISDLALALPGDAEARELPGWLDKLKTHRQAGKFDALQAGLRRWRDLLEKVAGDRKAVIEEAARLLDRARDIAGTIWGTSG